MSRDEGFAQVRLPSGEIRRINEECYATIGQVGNTEHENVVLGKAGRTRHRVIAASPVVWRATRLTIRTAAVRANPRAVAAGSSWCRRGARWPKAARRARNTRLQTFIIVQRNGLPMKNK